MNRRRSAVENPPSWTLEASETFLLELRQPAARTVDSTTATNDEPVTVTTSRHRYAYEVGGAGTFTSTPPRMTAVMGRNVEVLDRHHGGGGVPGAAAAAGAPSTSAEIGGLGQNHRPRFLSTSWRRRMSSDHRWRWGAVDDDSAAGGMIIAPADDDGEGTEVDEALGGLDDGRQDEDRIQEEEESRQLALQMYEFSSMYDFLSYLEQILRSPRADTSNDKDEDNDDDSDDDMDEFGGFQSAAVPPVDIQSVDNGSAQQQPRTQEDPIEPEADAASKESAGHRPKSRLRVSPMRIGGDGDSDGDGDGDDHVSDEQGKRDYLEPDRGEGADPNQPEAALATPEASATVAVAAMDVEASDDTGSATVPPTSPEVSTPVLLGRVDSILGRYGNRDHARDDDDHDDDAKDANDSSGDATCDTQNLVQFTDSLLVGAKTGDNGAHAAAEGTAGLPGRERLVEEKKEDCTSVEAMPIHCTGTASSEKLETPVRASSDRTPTGTVEGDPSLSSCSQESRRGSTAVSRDGTASNQPLDDQDSAAVPFGAGASGEDPPKVPEVIVALSLPVDTTSSGFDGHASAQLEVGRIDDHRLASRLSMQLPVNDLTTLEGRFTRRRQQQQQPQIMGEASLADTTDTYESSLRLPAFYYSSTIDDTVHVLRSLPWDLLETDEGREQWDERIELRLRDLDGSLNDLQAQIASSLSTQDLEAVNNLVHEWQTHLDLALMYADRAKGSLDGILEQPDDVDELWRQRETVRGLHNVLECVNGFVKDKLGLDARIDAFDVTSSNEYESLSLLAQRLATQASVSPLVDLQCLDGLRADVQTFGRRFWNRLLELNEAATISACHGEGIDVVHHRKLLHQALELDLARAADGSIDFRKEWSRSTRDTLFCEADRALANVLFDCGGTDSSLESIVKPLKAEFNSAGSDRTRIRAITHNLVIVRFQMSFSNLAHVAHALLSRMWNVLDGHQQLISLTIDLIDDKPLEETCDERPRDDSMLRSIVMDMQESRRDVWEHCVEVVAQLFTEYFSFATTPPLFEGEDDSRWSLDLDGLRQVLALVDRFLSMRPSFVEGDSTGPGYSSDLDECLRNVLLRHVRGVHVEAMNATGRILSNETWILDPVELSSLEGAFNVTTALTSLARHMTSGMSLASMDSSCFSDVGSASPGRSNPFGTDLNDFVAQRHEDSNDAPDVIPGSALDLDRWNLDMTDLVSSCIEAQDDRLRLLAPRCVTAGLLQWTARLHTVMKLLPPVVEEASAVLVDLLDLHVTTAFRLCCGSAKVEKILLGTVKPTPFTASDGGEVRSPQHRTPAGSSPLFSSRRKAVVTASHANGSDANLSLPAALDAEICSPLLKDLQGVLRLRGFLLRAQDGLRDVVNLDRVNAWLPERSFEASHNETSYEERCCSAAQVLEKRATALLSCNALVVASVAGFLDTYRHLSSTATNGRAAQSVESLEPLGNYLRALVSVVPTLWSTAGRFACVRAMSGADIVRGVVKVGSLWRRSAELHEQPNEYVYDASERCALVWGYLCLSRKLPTTIRATLWTHMVGGAHHSLLEGFARISGTTTEGRSLMMLDLAALTGELNGAAITDRLDAHSIVAPPPPSVPLELRVDGAVETYVKMTYFPKPEAVAWMEENVDSYKLYHALGLAGELSSSSSDDDPDDRRQLVQRLRELYAQREKEIVAQQQWSGG